MQVREFNSQILNNAVYKVMNRILLHLYATELIV